MEVIKIVSPLKFIRNVNKAVREKRHGRRIQVVKQNIAPSSGKHTGLALTYHWRNKDEIRIPRGLPKNIQEARRFGKTDKGKMIKKRFNVKRIPTEKEVLRHELWHVARPNAPEKTIKRIDHRPLPSGLPKKRTKGFDKGR